MKQLCVVTTHSVRETEQFARQFAARLSGGETLLLNGEMGAGKTHFVKGLAAGLGIEDVVTSPTFALHNSYDGILTLNHFDFYRLDDSAEAELLGLNEFFGRQGAVAAIEWGERVSDLLPRGCIVVDIAKMGDDDRKITVSQEI